MSRKSEVKIAIIGEDLPLKMGIKYVLNSDELPDNLFTTFGSTFTQIEWNIKPLSFKINLWEVSNSIKFSNSIERFIHGFDGIIIVFNSDDKSYKKKLGDHIKIVSDTNISLNHSFKTPIWLMDNSDNHHHNPKFFNPLIDKFNNLMFYFSINSIENKKSLIEDFNNYLSLIFNVQIENHEERKQKNQKYPIYFAKSTYLLSFHMDYGPVIVAKSPNSKGNYFTQEELSYAVKLYSVLDFDDLISYKYRIGFAPWPIENASIFYIAFVTQNELIRGGYDMFILAVTLDTKITNLVLSQADKIKGHILRTINNIIGFLYDFRAEIKIDDDQFTVNHNIQEEEVLNYHLNKLREELNTLILDLIIK